MFPISGIETHYYMPLPAYKMLILIDYINLYREHFLLHLYFRILTPQQKDALGLYIENTAHLF